MLNTRFTGEAASLTFLAFGVCLAPVLLDETGRIQLSSAEVLRVTRSEFAFLDTGVVLSSRPLLTFVEENVTRASRCSLAVFAYEDKVQHVRDFFAVLNTENSSSEIVKRFGSDFRDDRRSVLSAALPLLLSLGELQVRIDISKRTRIYTLGDTAPDAVDGLTLSAPDSLRLTVRANRFESRLPQPGSNGGVDTLIWEVNSSNSFVTVASNTILSLSPLPAGVVLNCRGFDITGNILTNAFTPTANRNAPALIVNPGQPRQTPAATVNMFTVTGNTLFGPSNLADFVREEWRARLPQELAALLTWDFFNTTG